MQDYTIALEISGKHRMYTATAYWTELFKRNKIRLQNATVQNHKVELTGKELTFRAYVSIENTGDSYNLKPLADNLDLTNLSNTNWKNIFQTTLQNSINTGINLNDAFIIARREADKKSSTRNCRL
jgi:elongation factor P--beta-lysine ligase